MSRRRCINNMYIWFDDLDDDDDDGLLMFILFYYILFFSKATVSAVLEPCRTCHMLFVLLARCVVCVLRK